MSYIKINEKKHVTESCLKNEISCEFCTTKFPKLEEVNHLNVCPKFVVPCPSGCGRNEIIRENVNSLLISIELNNSILSRFFK